MKEALIIIAYNAASISCFVGDAICAVKGIEGWGWFLFVGILVSAVPSSKK